jgi:hypothetical protein
VVSGQQPGILSKIADEMELVSRSQKTGEVVSKPNFKRFVVNESVDTSTALVPEKPEVGEIQVMDVMPREEALSLGASGRVVANSENRKNCVEFLLVNKIKMPSGNVVVKIPDAKIFETVIGRANADLVDQEPDYCLALEHAEPNEDGIGKVTLNLQPGSGGLQFLEVVRGYSTDEVQYELYPTAPLLKKHALTIFLHDGHFIRNGRLATTIAKCNPGLKGTFTLVDIKELSPKLKPGETRDLAKPVPRILTLNGDAEFLKSLEQFNKNYRFKLCNKVFYLNGGVRRDSSSETVASAQSSPDLPISQISGLLKAHNAQILAEAKRQEAQRNAHK